MCAADGSTDPAYEDTYLLAMWMFWLFNPEKPPPQLSSAPTPAMAGAIPKRLFPLWKRMVNPNARTRLSTINFVAEAQSSGIWSDNPLVALVEGLDGFELRSDGEKAKLLRTIKDAAEGGSLPEPFLVHRVLPSLLHSLSLPNAPSAQMLPLVLALGKQVPPSTYAKVVLDPVIKLYASPDRGTRMALLDGLEEYADRLDKHMVTERIWPHLTTGFADTVPVIREATIKAVYPLAGKLSDRILNNDLLRLLAKMQQDQEASIRTNTCILLGRLAPMLGHNTKKKVLVPAFARSLKDTFVHARVAALMALMATVECYDRDDLAGRVIPNMAHALVDKEKIVRDQAFKAMAMFVKRVEEMVSTMPATVLTETERPVSPPQAAGAGMVTSAAGAAGSLAGWAFSSLGKHLQSGEANSAMTAAPAPDAPSPAFTPSFASPAASRRESAESVPRPSASRLNSASRPKPQGHGMKLAHTKPKTNLMDELAAELDDDEVANAWGTDDLMDVNADADDWTAFESAAPVVEAPPPQSYYVSPPKKAEPLPAPKPVKAKPPPAKPAPAKPAPPPVASPVSEGSKPATPQPSLAGMSKEEKEKEMARRREERKARIAAMKEQKKAKA
jgi:SCY1-like protein 1